MRTCVVVALVAVLSVAAHNDGDQGSTRVQELIDLAYASCRRVCLFRVKSEAICERGTFCDFVAHTEEEHTAELLEIWRKADFNHDVVDWAITDTVEWRVRTKNEDPETVAEQLKERLTFWQKTLQKEL
eukprot:TRINITY_DN8998_c0_g1_i1.p3 TRINITY_DN8998_c0_g1~~TRINITY_DN8998_c0_g1_i1.p3  ORF type:complete len:129 (-),score=46.53 TRINITY_DN8998_c0_g1_i1:31-417(-)